MNDQEISCQNGVLKSKNFKSVSYICYNILWKKKSKHFGDKKQSMLKKKIEQNKIRNLEVITTSLYCETEKKKKRKKVYLKN